MTKYDMIIAAVCERYGVDESVICLSSRGSLKASAARQIVYYLLNVTKPSVSMGLIARMIGRDRTTVGYGIRQVEDRRELNSELDEWLSKVEEMINDRISG